MAPVLKWRLWPKPPGDEPRSSRAAREAIAYWMTLLGGVSGALFIVGAIWGVVAKWPSWTQLLATTSGGFVLAVLVLAVLVRMVQVEIVSREWPAYRQPRISFTYDFDADDPRKQIDHTEYVIQALERGLHYIEYIYWWSGDGSAQAPRVTCGDGCQLLGPRTTSKEQCFYELFFSRAVPPDQTREFTIEQNLFDANLAMTPMYTYVPKVETEVLEITINFSKCWLPRAGSVRAAHSAPMAGSSSDALESVWERPLALPASGSASASVTYRFENIKPGIEYGIFWDWSLPTLQSGTQ